MKRTLLALSLVTALVAACSSGGGGGGGGGPSNSVTGTIGGQSIHVKSGLIVPDEPIGNSHFASIYLSDKDDICGQAKLGNFTPSSTWFKIQLGVATSTGGSYTLPTAPGAYDVNAAVGNYALAAFYQFDNVCHVLPGSPVIASGGSANVVTFDANGSSGTANLTFGADHVTAKFDVQSCPELLTISVCQ